MRENNKSEENKKDFELNITNAIWGEQTYTFLPSYLDLLAENYGAGLHLMDFINEPEKSRLEINQWVSDETKNKINNLLSEGSISSLTRLVLTNAIYFKAKWMSQFEDALTHEGNFTLLDGTIVQVPMMQQTESFGYYSADGYQAITLPYEGNKISMLVLLPDGGRFKEIEDAISNNQIKEIIANTQYTQVNLNLPKFKIETSFGLADILGQMGMPDAFSPGVADFSGMDGTKDLYISAILHKAYIDVDENGTEAAAATAVVVGVTSMPLDPIKVSIDRPFIFFILDNKSGTVLFMGKVINPDSE